MGWLVCGTVQAVNGLVFLLAAWWGGWVASERVFGCKEGLGGMGPFGERVNFEFFLGGFIVLEARGPDVSTTMYRILIVIFVNQSSINKGPMAQW